MNNKSNHSEKEPKLFDLLHEDIKRGGFRKTIQRDFHELKEFFLNENRKKSLKEMKWFRRVLYTTGWLFKSLFLKLSPARRLLLILGIVLLFIKGIQFEGDGSRVDFNFTILGGVIFLFILMLELKDKLLARSELEAGRAVQKAFLPERNPAVEGWSIWLYSQTANEVGGDLIDFQKISNERIVVSLADLSGKGLSAALLMAKLQATIRALAPDINSLSELGIKINKIFCRDSQKNFFASLVYSEFGVSSGKVRMFNAGHLPPIIVRDNEIIETEKGDPAIGLISGSVYNEQQIILQKGDFLFIYSDGITDAKNELGEFYGSQSLFKILQQVKNKPVHEIGEMVLKEIEIFIGDTPLYDDLSIVIIQRTI
jgi:phosphoserine phosphatase RsbU/P